MICPSHFEPLLRFQNFTILIKSSTIKEHRVLRKKMERQFNPTKDDVICFFQHKLGGTFSINPHGSVPIDIFVREFHMWYSDINHHQFKISAVKPAIQQLYNLTDTFPGFEYNGRDK